MRQGEPLPFVGIDLTAGVRATDVAALNRGGTTVRFDSVRTDDEIVAIVRRSQGRIVAIDSPMGFPAGLCCLEASCACFPSTGQTGRSAERELARRGIPCFWTTKKTIIKTMIYRAIALKQRLEAEGSVVLEVYPYAVKRVLLGRDLPRKSSAAGLARLVTGAQSLLPDCQWPGDWSPSHDQLDALFCAMTARLFSAGQTELLGDISEVPIVLPYAPPRGGASRRAAPAAPLRARRAVRGLEKGR